MNKKVSVITASYNYAEFLKEAVESVIAQTYTNWELIVVDDGSTDNSVEVIKEFCARDERIKFFRHLEGENRGLKETLILGIEKATGDYIAFLESDDIWEQNCLEEKIKVAAQYPEAKIIFSDVDLFGNEEIIEDYARYFELNDRILSSKKYPANLFSAFSFQNVIPTFSCAVVEAETLKKADFNPTVEAFLDHWVWAHLAYDNKFYYINQRLTRWRMHTTSLVGRRQNKNEKQFLSDILKSFQKKGFNKNMFFWNRHRHPKIEKIFRGLMRRFV
ncbi:MAG TPA: glycosyltransferase [Candidatus Gastranaerophilaceae bacterium]|nr:glycosyltransferase [Candidatus Gastranaerophilaceae bacterium]HPT41917.1 glycosyltransferase [Candidatus Gastranaerophilaceae bacterium]